MLFQAGFDQLYPDLAMLISYTAIIVTLMIIINQLGFKHYIATRRHKKNLLNNRTRKPTIEIKGTIIK
jgi:hypothetical protein